MRFALFTLLRPDKTKGIFSMLFEILLFLATTSAPQVSTELQGDTSQTAAISPEQIGAELVSKITEICARHPEVERAFVVAQRTENGQLAYTFIPIFDRKVADVVISEADAAYADLLPSGPGLQVMLLARNSWKKTLAGVQPIYIRPDK
jgi:hypothetical protein